MAGPRERRIGSVAGLEVGQRRQGHRQFSLGDGADHARGAVIGVELVQDGERLAPKPLAAEEPITEFVVDGRPSEAGGAEVGGHPLEKHLGLQARVGAGRDGPTVAGEQSAWRDRAGGGIRGFGRLDHRDDLEPEGLRELEVAVVVGRHGHDRPGAVAGEHVVGHPDRHGLARERVDDVRAGEDAGLLAGEIGAVEIALPRGRFAIDGDRIPLVGGREPVDERMLGGHDHGRDAIQRVGPRGVDPQYVVAGRLRKPGRRPAALPGVERGRRVAGRRHEEIHLGTGAAADPVALELLDALGPGELVEFAFEAVGVGGDPQHPLPQRDPHHRVAAPLADAADHLLVGQDGAESGAPIDWRLRLVGQPVGVAISRHASRTTGRDRRGNRQFRDRPSTLRVVIEPRVVEHQEDPLRPADVGRVGGRDLPAPVVAEAEHLQLAAKGGDVAGGALGRGRAGAEGMLLGRQAEGVEAHRVHHTGSPHPLEPGHDVGGRVALRVADVQPVAARVGEHVEHIRLAAARWGQPRCGEGVVRVPPGLPLRLDPRGLVAGHPKCPGKGPRAGTSRGAQAGPPVQPANPGF